ncbi:unnamed protein product, partial [marine sediment metagenome]
TRGDIVKGLKDTIDILKEKFEKELNAVDKVFKEENEKLKEELIKEKKECVERWRLNCASNASIYRLEEENTKLKEKVEDLEAEGNKANEWVVKLTKLEKELKEENKKLKEGTLLKFQEVEIEDLKEELVKGDAAVEALKFMGYKYNNGGWEEEEEEDVEYNSDGEPLEKDKYDGDDWALGCGFTTKDGEYRMNMCGGCAEWFDYVINKNRCFIHNKDGKKKVRTFVSCPEGNYVKVLELGAPDYKLAEGETDMFEMVKECFTEEIMEYEEDEWENPNETEDGEIHGF